MKTVIYGTTERNLEGYSAVKMMQPGLSWICPEILALSRFLKTFTIYSWFLTGYYLSFKLLVQVYRAVDNRDPKYTQDLIYAHICLLDR